MKHIALFIFIAALLLTSCQSSQSKREQKTISKNMMPVVDVDQILAKPEKYIEKTVNIKGLVVHTCRHSGKKMFLAGTDKNKFVKVIAGTNVSMFDQSLEGETVVATGTLTLLDESPAAKTESGKEKIKPAGTSEGTTTAGCVTEEKIKNYQLICNSFNVVD